MNACPVYVIVPTKGRREGVARLVAELHRQEHIPDILLVVGADSADVPAAGQAQVGFNACYLVSDTAGAARQRNYGLETLDRDGALDHPAALVAFFDDDFRPDPKWFSNACAAFNNPNIVAITGTLLADGAVSGEVNETEAAAILDLRRSSEATFSPAQDVAVTYNVDLYGCNMMVRANLLKAIRFDEALPLYSWLEDLDLQAQLVRHGSTAQVYGCLGVHLGTRGGRTSGVRFGYSQIANPVYLTSKGSMNKRKMMRFAARAFASNLVFSLKSRMDIDYAGRLKGNCRAFFDVIRGRLHPTRILSFT